MQSGPEKAWTEVIEAKGEDLYVAAVDQMTKMTEMQSGSKMAVAEVKGAVIEDATVYYSAVDELSF